jgi:NUMOD3 motif
MGCIYALNFPSGKQYIGMTSMLLSKRMAIHRMALKRKCSYALYRAWRKHGDPEIKTLAIVEKHMLRNTERKAIAVFGTMVPNGYNLVCGGEGGEISAESRRKMSLASKGKTKSIEHRKKLSLALMGNTRMLGRSQSSEHVSKRIRIGWNHSDETKLKVSLASKKRTHSPEIRAQISASMKVARAIRPDWPTRS